MTCTIRALPFVVIATVACSSVYAQHLTCYPIKPGETAARLAGRLTGDPRNRHEPWFQIVVPGIERAVPKREYEHIHAGWHVCVATERLIGLARPSAYPPAPRASEGLVHIGPTPQVIALLALLLSGAICTWIVAARHVAARRVMVDAMRTFGNKFVDEFERPLFRKEPTDSVVNFRLRFVPRRRQLEIRVAPGAGRTYPNLADHKKNVEYDVTRIVTHLDDGQFVNDRLYADGEWVVIPFRLRNDGQ